MEIEFSINYRTTVPLKSINNRKEFLAYKKEISTKLNAQLDQTLKNSHKDTEDNMPSAEKLITSMEPTHLHVHLDSGFEDRNRHQFVNLHRKERTFGENADRWVLKGLPSEKIIQPDSQIIIAATNKVFNLYLAKCGEDAGIAYVPLSDIFVAAKLIDARIDHQEGKMVPLSSVSTPFFLEDIPLKYRAHDAPGIKGHVDFIVHKITFDQGIRFNNRIEPTHNVPQNVPVLRTLMNNYLNEFGAELGKFVPLAKHAEELNCPVYPSENTFIGEGELNIPLPGYLRFETLETEPSFWVNVLNILVDRKYPMRPRRSGSTTRQSQPTTPIIEEVEGSASSGSDSDTEEGQVSPSLPLERHQIVHEHLARFMVYFVHRNQERGRARWMAKFIVLFIQQMDYLGDMTYFNDTKKRVAVEMFSEILLTYSGDCEDSARGLVRVLNAFIDNLPHLPLLYRALTSLSNEREASLYEPELRNILSANSSSSSPPNASALQSYQQNADFWSQLTGHMVENAQLYANRLSQLAETNRGGSFKGKKDTTFSYYGGNLHGLFYAVIFREFHRIACSYVDAFTLFGVRDTHVQNIPKDKRSSSTTTTRTEEEMMIEDMSGAHAAVILWPDWYFRESIGRWNSEHILATEQVYIDWLNEQGYKPEISFSESIYPKLNTRMLEPLILEGTGMLEPSARKDPIPNTRKQLASLPFFSMIKKELNPEHFDSKFYQSVMLLVSPRFITSTRIATFNVTKPINIHELLNRPTSPITQHFMRGLKTNDEILSPPSSTSRLHTNNKLLLKQYMDKYEVGEGETVYTKGLPFATVISGDPGVVLVPFGFSRKALHERLMASLRKGVSSNGINGSVEDTHKAVNYIQNNFFLQDKTSVCEFDPSTLGLIDNVAKQAILVPPLKVRKFVHRSVENSLDLLDRPAYRHLNQMLSAYPFPNPEHMDQFNRDLDSGAIVRYSGYIRSEQLSSGEAVTKFLQTLKTDLKAGFLQALDYNVEHYTDKRSAIRIDFYVTNLE